MKSIAYKSAVKEAGKKKQEKRGASSLEIQKCRPPFRQVANGRDYAVRHDPPFLILYTTVRRWLLIIANVV